MDLLDALRPHRALLVATAVVGGVGLNGVFLYQAALHPDVVLDALRNPVALVFILEAFVVMALLAWAVAKAGLGRPGWRSFVVLSIAGGLAFALPAFVLWHLRRRAAVEA